MKYHFNSNIETPKLNIIEHDKMKAYRHFEKNTLEDKINELIEKWEVEKNRKCDINSPHWHSISKIQQFIQDLKQLTK